MHVIVAGCGRVGADIAQFLSYESHDVVVIDSEATSFQRLGGTFNGITIEGDAFDKELLIEAGIEEADAFAGVTNNDNTNLLTSKIARDVYNVPTVISRLSYPEKELTYFRMDIDYICSTTLTAALVREKLYLGGKINVQQDRPEVGIQVVDLEVPPEAEGTRAGELNFGISSRLVTLLRHNREIYWNSGTLLCAGDMLVLSICKDGWKNLKEILGVDEALSRAFSVDKVTEEVTPGEVVIGGCSAVGAQLAAILEMDGHRVSIIDTEPWRFKRLGKFFEGRTIEGTQFNKDALLKAGIETADYFAAVSRKDNANMMASEVARNVFGVPRVVARLFNRDKEATYQELNLEYVCGTRMVSQAMLERILKPLASTKGSACNNKLDIFEFECPCKWDGMTVRKAWEKSGIAFAYILRRSSGYLPEDNFVLRKGGIITGVAASQKIQKFEKYLQKNKKG